jgi:hypothetical protein
MATVWADDIVANRQHATAASNCIRMLGLRRIILTLLSFLIPVVGLPVSAQTLEPTWEQFNEELRPAALISGSLVAGFQRAGPAPTGLAISTLVPAHWAGERVCVRVWTANGRYEAQNEYMVPDISQADELAIQFPTAHEEFLLEQSAEEIAALTSLGGCDVASDELAVTMWNNSQGPVQLLLNSFRADLVFVYVGDQADPVQCRPVEADIRSAYDVICDLDLGQASGNTTLEVFRYTNRQAAAPTSLTVFVSR